MSRRPERKTCNDCDGDGYKYGSKRCSACRGRGWVKGWLGGETTCGNCDGSGSEWERIECSSCDGKGYNVVMTSGYEDEPYESDFWEDVFTR